MLESFIFLVLNDMSQFISKYQQASPFKRLDNIDSLGESNSIANDSRKTISSWTKVLNEAFRDPIKLLEYLDLNSACNRKKIELDSKFRMLVPLSYAAKMKKGDWNDPLLRQVLPLKDENDKVEGFVSDPVGDLQSEISPGLLHKYKGRMLLVTTGACPVHCRYCFRREYPYLESTPDKKHWENTLNKVKNDKTVSEVILSGGDPLMLSDSRLQRMCKEIEEIPHVTTIRFHSRVPIFLPERISVEFLSWIRSLKVNVVIVIHSNHANELDGPVSIVLKSLREAGVTLLNQSVFLKGVNDSLEELEKLSTRLFSCQVLPYYIHQLDRVQGASHFEVDESKSFELIEKLKNQLSGYLIPKFVREVSGKRSKQTIVKIQK